MKDTKKIFDTLQQHIQNAEIPENERLDLMKNLARLREHKINLMITGATGSGKSSTINALFGSEVATVGVGTDPETMDISKYELENLILWDSPGLGDGKERDNIHSKNIISKLLERDDEGELLIDLVLVVLDGGSRDLGTSYELINNVIIPNLGENPSSRILVAINQADVAMKGKHWNYEKNKPEPRLEQFLNEQALSVKKRIKEATDIDIDPIYYAAGYKDDDDEQTKPYNLSKLLSYILKLTPAKKRLVYIDNINKNTEIWEKNDELSDYGNEIKSSFLETFSTCLKTGGAIGGAIGSIFGPAGATIGGIIGSGIGAVVGAIGGLFGLF